MDETSPMLVELTRPECLDLLVANTFGRVVVATANSGLPMIRPVNYVFDVPSQSVVFRTGEGSKFHALVHSAQACFEIDAMDPDTVSGWSVIIVGRTEEIVSSVEINRLDQLGLANAGPASRTHWIRIRARTVSGRRVVRAAD